MNYTEQYIKVLKKVNESSEKFHITEKSNVSDSDRRLFTELAKDGYINGKPQSTGKGLMVLEITPTVKGRIFQDELEQKQYEQTFKGRILKHSPLYIAFILGLLTNIITFFFLQK